LGQILDFEKYKIVVTFHNNKQIVEIDSLMKHFYRYTLKKVLRKFTKIIVVSPKVKRILSPFSPENQNIFVVGNGVETGFPKMALDNLQEYLPSDKKSFKIISVGNLINTKGFDLLIQTVSDLNQASYDIDLTIVGAGPEKEELIKLITTNDMCEKIHLLGRVEHDIVMNLYKHFDAFVLPSWSETFGIVYLEAMLAKLPVIGIKGEGIDGVIVDGENGLLAKPKALNSLKQKIMRLHDIDYRNQISSQGYETVTENYTLDMMIKRIEVIYER